MCIKKQEPEKFFFFLFSPPAAQCVTFYCWIIGAILSLFVFVLATPVYGISFHFGNHPVQFILYR